MSRPYISKSIRLSVAAKARHRCGYCLTSQEYSGALLEIEHIIPLTRGGARAEENLWLACSWCNRFKSAQVDSVDPATRRRVSLFNPRGQSWSKHFHWSEDGTQIIGKSACGRATVAALQLNHTHIVAARRRWVSAGWHPPKD